MNFLVTVFGRSVGWFSRRGFGFSREQGNAFVLMITMFPMLMTAFAMSFDLSRNFYIKSTIQSSLDQAAVAGASTTVMNATGTKVEIDINLARGNISSYYASNVAVAKGVNAGSPDCDIQLEELRCTVNASSKNMWGGIFGWNTQDYNIVSYARINDNTSGYRA